MWSKIHTNANTDIIENVNRNTKRQYNNEMKTGTTWGIGRNTQMWKCIRHTKTGAKYKYTYRCDLGKSGRIQMTLKIQLQTQIQEENTNTNTGVIWASGRGWEMGSRQNTCNYK